MEQQADNREQETRPGSRAARFGLRLLLAAGLVALLLSRTEWSSVAGSLARLSPVTLLLLVVGYVIAQASCAFKWSLLSAVLGFRRPLRFYLSAYFAGAFASLFLPTMVGGDVLRGALLAGRDGDRAAAAVSVLADRGTGLLALVLLGAGAAWTPAAAALPAVVRLLLTLAGGAGLVLFAAPFALRQAPQFTRARGAFWPRVLQCWQEPAPLLLSFALSLVFQSLLCVLYTVLGAALEIRVPFAYYFMLCPLASLAGMSPVTLGGIGERSGATVLLFSLAGVAEPAALAFALGWSSVVALASLAAGGLGLLLRPAEGRGAAPALAEDSV